MALTTLRSDLLSSAGRPKCLMRLAAFLVSMWLLLAFL
jgi:hypothetical protein